ncbi:MAG TPA: LysR family transcriptional regulator [Rhizomicrobium sp.]|jgi:DNA-binding transcriptional LysR family regulator
MTLEQLRIFVAVAQRQHMTEAAKTLGLTQSAASAAIAALEEHYDTKLFHRIGRGIALTEEGRRFLDEARAVLARAEAAEQVLSEMTGLKHGLLRVQASQTVAGYWLPRYLVDFRAAYPGVRLELTVGNTEQAAAAVHDGAADLGFVEGKVNDPRLAVREIARDRLMLVVGARHPWAGRRHISPEDILTTPWILREKGSGTRAMFERALADFGIDPSMLNILIELPSNEAVRSAVIAGEAATVLSASVLVAGLESDLLCAPSLALPERAFYVVTHKERHVSRAAAALLKIIHPPPAASPTSKRG